MRRFPTIIRCVRSTLLDLLWVYAELAPHYPTLGRPSIDPVLMIRMLIIGYVFGLRSERLLCREVQVNFAYRWFCKLGIEHKIPDHSAFSRARNERFGDSGIFRRLFERVVEACITAGLVGGEGFAVDASLIQADANKHRSITGLEWQKTGDPETASRAMQEYLEPLMTRPLVRRATLRRSSCRHPILPHNGQARCAERRYSPTPTTI
jgi:transposase